jgi:hypothetical protein
MALGRLFTLVATALLLGTFLTLGACSYRMVEDSRLNTTAITRTMRDVTALRHLPLKRDLTVELVNREHLRGELIRQFEKEVDPAKMAVQEQLFKKLGLLDPALDLSALLLDMLTEQIAGYYDPETGMMRLIEGSVEMGGLMGVAATILRRDLAGEFLLAHELTHALNDQHFNLTAFLDTPGNQDSLAARKAFVEGEAMLVGLNYVLRRPMKRVTYDLPPAAIASTGEGDNEKSSVESQWARIPTAIRRQLMFSYIDGGTFAVAVYTAGGTRALDRVYTDPPASSEHILHPLKYLKQVDPPVNVELPDVVPEMAALKLVEEDTMGEIGVLGLLEEPIGLVAARIAAAGWGGDRYRLYVSEANPENIGLYWETVWDTKSDQVEFDTQIRATLRKRYGAPTDSLDSTDRWETKDGVYEIRTAGPLGVHVLLYPN